VGVSLSYGGVVNIMTKKDRKMSTEFDEYEIKLLNMSREEMERIANGKEQDDEGQETNTSKGLSK